MGDMAAQHRPVNIAQALEAELERRQTSHRAAGEAIGVSQATFSRWVNNEMRPSPEYRPKLVRWLGMAASDYDRLWRASAKAKPDRRTRSRIDLIEAELSEVRKLLVKIAAQVGVDP